MNTSIIIDDIRKRSIRVQRDKILDRIRQEEEIAEAALPRRIILEAEEKAKQKILIQGWKKTACMVILGLGVSYVIYRLLAMQQQKKPERKPPVIKRNLSIQTEMVNEQDDNDEEKPNRKTVKFEIDGDEEEVGDAKLEKLQTMYPKLWKTFERDSGPEWLVSNLTGGKMAFDFYSEEMSTGIDMISSDMLQYPGPSTVHFETQEDFENSIYNRKLKEELCEDNSLVYKLINLDLETP